MRHSVPNWPAPSSIWDKVETQKTPNQWPPLSMEFSLSWGHENWPEAHGRGLPSGWRALLKASLTLLSLESALPAQEVSLLSLQRPLLPQSFVLNKSSLLKLSVSGHSFPACASTTSSSQAVARCFRRKCCSSLSPPSPSFSPASPGSLWQGPSLKPDKEDWRKLPLPSSPLFLSAIQRRPLASKSPEAC